MKVSSVKFHINPSRGICTDACGQMDRWTDRHRQTNSLISFKLNRALLWRFSVIKDMEMYRISRPVRRTVIFLLEILEKYNDECILIVVIYWKKTGFLHTKISNHNIIYSP